jgi:hypothetical protein
MAWTMATGAAIYLVAIVLVIWAGSRRMGSRWFYVMASGMASVAGALAIVLSPSSKNTGLAPPRPWEPLLLDSGSWMGGGLLLLGLAALVASLLYRGPSDDVPEELDS